MLSTEEPINVDGSKNMADPQEGTPSGIMGKSKMEIIAVRKVLYVKYIKAPFSTRYQGIGVYFHQRTIPSR